MNEKILKYKIPIITVFVLITVLSVLLLPKVTVNYDLMDYLPKDSPSTKALEAMESAFGELSDGGGTRVLTQNVTIAEALEYKSKINAVPGVSEVLWLDDYANLNQPLSFINEKQLNSYYKDNNALFTVRFEESTTGKETAAALSAIREIIGEDGAMSGGAVKNTAAKQETSGQVKTMMLWLVPVVLLIMLFATSSWFEPVLFIITIGIAIIVNMGTNAFLDDISFVTQTAAAVLQLVVSIDYSIFLLHSFAEQRGKGLSPREAMLAAMKQSYPSIIASAVTTILGFAVLVLMRFLIGADMGIVLAKGVVFSLLSVIVLLPGLALLTYKLIDKTHHRSFFPSFERFGKLVVKIAAPVMIIIVVIAVPAFLAQGENEFIYGDSAVTGDETSQIGRDERVIGELFGKQNQLVLLVPEGDFPKELTLANEFLTLPYVSNVTSYVTSVGMEVPVESVPADRLAQLISGGYSRMVLSLNTDTESDEAFAAVEEIRRIAGDYYGDEYHLSGGSVNVYDMREVVTQDNKVVTIAAIVAIGLVILFTFKSLSIPLLLVLAIESAIWLNLSVPYFMGSQIVYIGFMIISAVQLGATVDYAILYASRYIEKRRELPKKAAAIAAISETASSILTSGVILFTAGIIIASISTNTIIAQLGELIGRGAALSCITVLFFLPGLLLLFDKLIRKTSIKLKFKED